MSCHGFITMLLLAAWSASSLWASPKAAQPQGDGNLHEYTQPIAGVDWDSMAPHFVQMIDRIFERNGWNDESDQYARKVATRVVQLPPWDLPGRLNVLSEEVATRYGLTPQQTAAFQRSMMREVFTLMVKHGPQLWDQAKEGLQGRAAGQPYTAEQIARWTKTAQPLYGEFEAGIERVAGEIERSMPKEKRDVFAKDMAAFQKRQKGIEEMSQRWAEGKWRPEEWGLEDDPVQQRGARAATPSSLPKGDKGAPRANPPTTPSPPPSNPLVVPVPPVAIPTHWVDHDPATWIALVVEVAKKYKLDAGQMDTAWSIHAELVDRARRYGEPRKAELSAVPEVQRRTSEAYQPIRELFGELRERLEALPSSAQRSEQTK